MNFDDFWSLETVRNYKTEEIFQKLNEFGYYPDRRRISGANSVLLWNIRLKKKWKSLYEISAQGRDKDFVSLGALFYGKD